MSKNSDECGGMCDRKYVSRLIHIAAHERIPSSSVCDGVDPSASYYTLPSHRIGQAMRVRLSTLRSRFTLLTATVCATRLVSGMATPKVIDSHLHVWASSSEAEKAFPYTQDPPSSLKDKASTSELLKQMEANGVDGSLIVQPINHKFDHSYVIDAIKSYPDRFKGMLLHDPSLEEETAVARLEELALQGFVGVRFNPYLWPKVGESAWSPMSEGSGLAVYRRCAELNMPVGVMCFQGLQLHYDDILQLIEKSPDTVLILDHFGFTSIKNEEVFEKLLALAKYPNVYVKISALFRLDDASPFTQVKEKRFEPLLKAFGAERLMYGSDFPYVLEQPEQYGMVKVVSSWIDNANDAKWIMGGTCEKIFGAWNTKKA